MNFKKCLPFGRKAMTNRDSILKTRDITLPTKVHTVKAMAFPISHVQMWELNHKEGWALKNWCFQTVVLEKTLENVLDSKEIKQVNSKGNQPWIFTGKMMLKLKLKLHYFGHLMRTDSLEKILLLGKIEGRKRKVRQKMKQLDSITNSMDMSLSNLWEIVNYLRNRERN